MAISWPSINQGMFKESNPVPDFQKAFQSGLDTYIKSQQAKYAPKKAELELQNIQSQIQQRGAFNDIRRKLYEANLRNIESQIGQRGAFNDVLRQIYEADLAKKRFEFDPQAQLDYISKMTKGVGGQESNQDQIIPFMQGQGAIFPEEEQRQNIPEQTTQQQMSGNGDYRQNLVRAMIKKATGMDPFAPTPQQKMQLAAEPERAKKLGALDVKQLGEVEERVLAGAQADPVLNEIGDILTNPVFQSVRQLPIAPGSELTAYKKAGTPEQREIIGQAETAFNQFIADSIKMWGPRMTDRDLGFMQRMKLSDRDSLEALTGKYKMLKLMHDLQTQRHEIASDLMRKNRLPMKEAFKQADKLVNAEEIRKKINDNLKQGKPQKKYSEDDYAHTAKKYNMSIEDIKRRIGAM